MRDGGLNEYDYSARRLNSALPLWTTPDPLALKYAHVSPYAYCASNPIKFTDPSGCEVQGVKSEDAKKAIQDFEEMFRDEVFTQFRKLFVMSKEKGKKKSLAKISQEAINQAFEGVTLSEDQQALVDMAVNTINSDDVHKIEYKKHNETLSKDGENAFLPGFMNTDAAAYMPQILDANGGFPLWFIINQGGSGATTSTKDGTHSVIVSDGEHPNGQAVTTGHEILGHGRSLVQNQDQHIETIRTENLILRVMGIPFVNDGSKHGSYTIVPDPSRLPQYR